MPSLRALARSLAAAILIVAQTGLARADLVVPDYGFSGNSAGLFVFNESTGAASGSQPFIQPVGSPSNPVDPAYVGDGYQAEGSAYGPDGNLYVGYFIAAANSGTGIGEVRRFNAVTGAYMDTFVAPGSGGLVQPGDIKFGADGNLYVADHGNFVGGSPYGGTSVIAYGATTGAYNAAATVNFGAPLGPSGLQFDPRPGGLGGNPNNLYISLFNTNQVMQYNTSTHALTTFATGNGAPPGFSGLGFGPDRNLYVVNLFAANVQQFNGSGTYVSTLSSTGSNSFPNGIVFTQGGKFLVSTLGPGSSPGQVLAYDGSAWNTFATSASLSNPGPLTLTPIAGDGNSDGIVNGLDIAQVASRWLTAGPTADVNHDGIVNGLDIALIATNWLHTDSIYGGGGGAGAAVPEPATIVLVLAGGVCAVVARARRRACR